MKAKIDLNDSSALLFSTDLVARESGTNPAHRPEVCPDDYVFLDDMFRPYRVRRRDGATGDLWLHYRTAAGAWVTLRIVSAEESEEYITRAIPVAKAEHYASGVPFLTNP